MQIKKKHLTKLNYKYFVSGYETDKDILQCFLILKAPQRIPALRKVFGSTSTFEVASRNNHNNRKFCCKQGDYVEFGEIIKRSDTHIIDPDTTTDNKYDNILKLRDAIINGKSDKEIITDNNLFQTWIDNQDVFQHLRNSFPIIKLKHDKSTQTDEFNILHYIEVQHMYHK